MVIEINPNKKRGKGHVTEVLQEERELKFLGFMQVPCF